MWGGGAAWGQFLADKLTLYQSRGEYYAHHITLLCALPGFSDFATTLMSLKLWIAIKDKNLVFLFVQYIMSLKNVHVIIEKNIIFNAWFPYSFESLDVRVNLVSFHQVNN